MLLVTVKARARCPEVVQQICDLGFVAVERFQEPGWLGGGCAVDVRDPLQVFVLERWSSRQALEAWTNSEAAARLRRESADLIVGDWQIDMYEEL